MKNTGSLFFEIAFGLLVVIFVSNTRVSAQTDSLFIARLDSLNRMAISIIQPIEDSMRLKANTDFQDALRMELLLDSTFQNDFGLLQTVSVLECPGKTFRIATWYVPRVDGTFRFFGYVQIPYSTGNASRLIELKEMPGAPARPVNARLGANNWFGAFYYELVHVMYRRKEYFILLGWKGNDRHTRMRVIEPFALINGEPVFGDEVFQIPGQSVKRVLFEYSSRASMSLNYYADFEFRGKRGRFPAIVFDRLVPMQPDLAGNFRFYVPEVNIFDALRFNRGRWEWIGDVDVRVFINPALQPLNPVD